MWASADHIWLTLTVVIKNQVLLSLRHVLAPLVRILLRNGVTWSEFTEIGKEVFVQVARDDYGIQGRATNTSRVALMTGLSRREVTRVKGVLLGQRPREAAAPSRISQILTAWHVDPQFIGPDGRPAPLAATGAGPSLATLLKQYAGDTPHGAVIKELEELGLMELGPQGWRVLARDYIRSASDPDRMRQAGVALHDHATTIAHNVDAKRAGPARFERMATHRSLPRRHLRAFNAYLETEGQAFLEKVDAWLSARGADHARDEKTQRTGVGVYQINEQHEGDR
jgi:hypothetical protein